MTATQTHRAVVVEEKTGAILACFYGPQADEWASRWIATLPGAKTGRYGLDIVDGKIDGEEEQ